MLILNHSSLSPRILWERIGVKCPNFDISAMRSKTEESPTWLHFGAGNIFRGFIARLQHNLLEKNLVSSGIIAADAFDQEIIQKIYRPHDNLTLMVDLSADGKQSYEILAGVGDALCIGPGSSDDYSKLMRVCISADLQMISFTITEKGYALYDMNHNLLPVVIEDMDHGPESPKHTMSLICAMLYHRYKNGAAPLALVSMDNCSHNGDKLRDSIFEIARAWSDRKLVAEEFLSYLQNPSKIAFPWSMIDKITPRPSDSIKLRLNAMGIDGINPLTTSRGTYIAPYVNAEIPQYLVIEDTFPNGRPPLEQVGVYLTDRETVDKVETMKVTTCLNPLHTALAVFGCLLGYQYIYEEMNDPDLSLLVRRIGYQEGLPVVVHPGIMAPEAFLDEVVLERLPNPYIPDMPQRIATDTSQKMPIRFGRTIQAYHQDPARDATNLVFIPLTIAAWLRYLLGVSDTGHPMQISPDPLYSELSSLLRHVRFGEPATGRGALKDILSNSTIFSVDLYDCQLADKIESMFCEMIQGEGAVRQTLQKYLSLDASDK
ncbi:MAG: mannitol dehydrogenase family protein [Clostridiaceae bacterium]|nr:mannitol dehydrogenase family protein [Clostridiaceae bacterium]